MKNKFVVQCKILVLYVRKYNLPQFYYFASFFRSRTPSKTQTKRFSVLPELIEIHTAIYMSSFNLLWVNNKA